MAFAFHDQLDVVRSQFAAEDVQGAHGAFADILMRRVQIGREKGGRHFLVTARRQHVDGVRRQRGVLSFQKTFENGNALFAVGAQRRQKQATVVGGDVFIQNRLFQRFERLLVQMVRIRPNGLHPHADILVFQKLGKNVVAMFHIASGQSGDFHTDGGFRIVRQRRDDLGRLFLRQRRTAVEHQRQNAHFLRFILEEFYKTFGFKRFREIPRGGENVSPHGEIFIVQRLVEDEQGFVVFGVRTTAAGLDDRIAADLHGAADHDAARLRNDGGGEAADMDIRIEKQAEHIHARRRGEKTLLREGDQRALADLPVRIAQALDDGRLRRRRTVFADDHRGATARFHIVALQVAQTFGDGLGFCFPRYFHWLRLLGAHDGHRCAQNQQPQRF